MAITAVLLDLYNTLVKQLPTDPFFSGLADTLKVPRSSFGTAYLARAEDTMRGRLYSMGDRVAAACRDIGAERPEEVVASAVSDAMPLFYGGLSLYPESRSVLAALRRRLVRTALVSNAASYSEPVLDRFALRGFFDATVLSYSVGAVKPEPSIYLDACGRLGVAPEQCLFVGDGGDHELEGARRLGMTTVLVDRLHRALPASYVWPDLTPLPDLVDRLIQPR